MEVAGLEESIVYIKIEDLRGQAMQMKKRGQISEISIQDYMRKKGRSRRGEWFIVLNTDEKFKE